MVPTPTHHAGPVRSGGVLTTANTAETKGVTSKPGNLLFLSYYHHHPLIPQLGLALYVFFFHSLFLLLLFPALIALSKVGTTCFHNVVIKIRQLFLRPAVCLTSTLLESGATANAAGTNGLTCLPKHEGARDFGH
jgi:hypothetical protein